MPVRNAFRLFMISVAATVIAGPAFAKYTEEWVNGKDVAKPQATTRGNAHVSVSQTTDAPHDHSKSKASSSPFASDPIAAFADDPIAAFARSRTK
ncbi:MULTISPECIES: hypothetical protein [unclassified Caballeronia]|uniref:hypothetical protein n=1 Tax=unclassified Caballeronia TaxID=2646786 RepID=UPI00285BB5B3|nr:MULTISPECIES: hypothetical protein [unclassified Caballeronia]MDR5738695.1 hypothetical protein [Caballeronia sp. LZ016]MDR5811436.1 hypothetical protein [Caballeronia sp. LZ019]